MCTHLAKRLLVSRKICLAKTVQGFLDPAWNAVRGNS